MPNACEKKKTYLKFMKIEKISEVFLEFQVSRNPYIAFIKIDYCAIKYQPSWQTSVFRNERNEDRVQGRTDAGRIAGRIAFAL